MTETLGQDDVYDVHPDGYHDPDDDLLVEDARHRPGRLTLGLAAAIVVAGAFGGGVLTQKHYGGSTVPAGQFGGAGRAGAFAGEAGFPGGAGGIPGGTGTSAGAGTVAGGAASVAGPVPVSVPVVVGTIVKVSGDTITVRNFAGKRVTVRVPDSATVSSSTSVSKLGSGSTVSVSGSTAGDGSVKASSVTATEK